MVQGTKVRGVLLVSAGLLALQVQCGGIAPYIARFDKADTVIAPGAFATLTCDFVSGKGVITPGNMNVASGMAVKVRPDRTTTYALTVTNLVDVTVTRTVCTTVDPSASVP